MVGVVIGAISMTAATAGGKPMRVFLFAGQSNMAGADALIGGDGAGTLEAAGLQTRADRRALFTYGADFADPPTAPWGPINGHTGFPGGYVHGPEVGFARALWDGGTRGIGIIKVAANIPYGQGLAWPWGKGEKGDSPDYYGRWQAFVRARLGELEASGRRCEVAGFVWHQGIDDGINRETEEAYAERLTRLIGDLREEYDCPDAPFIMARSADSQIATPAAMVPIRAAQVRVAEADELAAWVDVDDLPNVNTHHFPAEAQIEIGRRMGEAYIGLVDGGEGDRLRGGKRGGVRGGNLSAKGSSSR